MAVTVLLGQWCGVVVTRLRFDMTERDMDTDIKLRRPATSLSRRWTHRTGVMGLMTVPLLLLATACGESDKTIGFKFSGKPQAGVPSRVAWDAHLTQSADNLSIDAGRLTITSGFLGTSRITALDAASGTTVFDQRVDDLPPDLDSVLASGGGRLLVGASGDGGVNGRVDAFDTTTGTLRWSASLDLDDPLPVIVGDAVVVANHDTRTGVGHVHLYALADGKERWVTPLLIAPVAEPDSNDHDRSAPLLAVDGNTLTVETGSGTSLAGIDLRSGEIAWQYDTKGTLLKVQPVEATGRVVVLSGGTDDDVIERHVEVLSTETGERVWSAETNDNTFVVNGDDVLVADGSADAWKAIDITGGATRWSNFAEGSSILAISDRFAVTEVLSVFDLSTGELSWRTGVYQESDDLHVVGDVVLADSSAHRPTAYDLATGETLWTLDDDGFIVEVIEQSGTVLTQNDDVVELRDIRTGAVLWTLTVGDKIGVGARTDSAGNLYIILDKYREPIATIVAITPPAA